MLTAPQRLITARIGLHPACRWLRTRHAALSIWSAHQLAVDDDGIDADAVDLSGIEADTPEEVLIARPAIEVRTLALPVGGAGFLDALAGGRSLIDAIILAAGNRDGFDPTPHFAIMIEHGLIVRLEPEGVLP